MTSPKHLPRPTALRMKQVLVPDGGGCLRPAERGKRNRAAAKRSQDDAVLGGMRRSFAASRLLPPQFLRLVCQSRGRGRMSLLRPDLELPDGDDRHELREQN